MATHSATATGLDEPVPTKPRLHIGRLPTVAALLAIFGIGGFLRLWQLGAVGYNSDEAVYSGTAAALAGDQRLAQFFPVFRAHPMMLQTMLSWAYRTGVSDVKGRAVVVAFGLATIWVTYLLGRLLYHQAVGLAAAAFMAVMPYAVVVSRQVLLDAPATLCATVALYCAARYCRDRQPAWLYAAAAAMGLAILTKETCVILLAGAALYLLGARDLRPDMRQTAVTGVVLVAVIAGWWGALALSGRTGTGGQYALWQFLRRQNHPVYFYLTALPASLGYALLALAIVGICWPRSRSWREGLLIWWAATAVLTYSLLPIKGFQYLEPIAPVLAIWAALALDLAREKLAGTISGTRVAAATAACITIVCATMAGSDRQIISPSASTTFLAGSGGLPGGREAGQWIAASLPRGATILTIGPSMANVLEFYGNRHAYALAVSPNNRNPSYIPVDNPDAELRQGTIQYLVWDSFSAARSQAFGLKLLGYVAKFRATLIYTRYETTTGHGHAVAVPVIRIYEVVRT
jgi:4-amino-4-deoxy-L-arabinose transferase-like glycosyltransferase